MNSCASSALRSTPPGKRMRAPRHSSKQSLARRKRDSDASSFAPASRRRTCASLPSPRARHDDLLAVARGAVPAFEALDDDRSLARAWLLIGYVRGGIHGNHAAWKEAEERALVYYRRTAFPPATCLGQIAAAIYWGPTSVSPGIERCIELLDDETLGYVGRAAVIPYLGGLHAQLGRLCTRPRANRRSGADVRRARRPTPQWFTAARCGLTSSCWPRTMPPLSERSASSVSTSNAYTIGRTLL